MKIQFDSTAQRLVGNWEVCSVPLHDHTSPTTFSFAEAHSVPECVHLQPFLFPDQPYWGDELRTVNEQAWLYRRTFPSPTPPFQRVRLLFEGVDYYAEVWLNGRRLGLHEGNFAPFEFDVTQHLFPLGKDNVLIVRVTSPWDAPNPKGVYPINHVVRGMVKGLYEHAEGVLPPNVNPLGIWRPVWLIPDQGVSFDQVRIRTDLKGTAELCFEITNATNAVWSGTLQINLDAENHAGQGTTLTLPVELATGKQTLEAKLHVAEPHLWWSWDQGEPNLYRLTARLLDAVHQPQSTLHEIFGFRTIELERTPERFEYRLNGQPIFIRGSSYLPNIYLSQCNETTLHRDLQLAKAANLNLLRVHIHVSPPELYQLCDEMGILVWQDFELNWVHDTTLEFEARARTLQHEMIALLGNHPSIMTWCCHNEPTLVFSRRHNLEKHPDPALYADAIAQDPTRPVFLCSGQLEDDWQRSGDTHSYYGAIWTNDYTDVYRVHSLLSTEFGCEAPAATSTLQAYPYCWERLQHLDGQIEPLWAYQADLIQFHVEHFRRLRANGCAGFVHFWLIDLVPQVGCGVLDAHRQPKGGYAALQRASQPLQVMLEHDGRQAYALWVCNDTPHAHPQSVIRWRVLDAHHQILLEGETTHHLRANSTQTIIPLNWGTVVKDCAAVELTLLDHSGQVLATNQYHQPFQRRQRPKGYPWKFDFELGTKVFDRPDTPSMITQSRNMALNLLPVRVRETLAEWVMRQRFPQRFISLVAVFFDLLA